MDQEDVCRYKDELKKKINTLKWDKQHNPISFAKTSQLDIYEKELEVIENTEKSK